MQSELPFLDAIRANPKDTACRLVYADWLQERGDPRGELIRIEEEMSSLPVFSDRFWQLKPRRHELRQSSPKEWLQVMRYGTDCPPTFAHVPDGWKEWWRLIRVFTERWHGFPCLPDVGGRMVEVASTEARLGRRLPPSVRELVAFAHDVRTEADYHDVLHPMYRYDVYQMRELQNQQAISLLALVPEYHWGVRHADLEIVDPPVNGYARVSSACVADDENPVASTLTRFALNYALAFGRRTGERSVNLEHSDELMHELRDVFPVHFGVGEEKTGWTGTVDVFETENILVRLKHSGGHSVLSARFFKPLAQNKIPAVLSACIPDAVEFSS